MTILDQQALTHVEQIHRKPDLTRSIKYK